MGYLKEQLQLRGVTFTNSELKKTYVGTNEQPVKTAAESVRVINGLSKADFIARIMELVRTNKRIKTGNKWVPTN